MSDTNDVTGLGHYALQGARVEWLRRRMKEFVADRDRNVDVRSIREETTEGTSLSEFVDEERTERI